MFARAQLVALLLLSSSRAMGEEPPTQSAPNVPPTLYANVPPPETSQMIVWRYDNGFNDRIVVCLAEAQARHVAGKLVALQEDLDKARLDNARNRIGWQWWFAAGIVAGAAGGGALVWTLSR